MEKTIDSLAYNPTKEEQEFLEDVLKDFNDMIEVSDQTYREFNDRTITQFLDDSQKRANAYTPTREEQGKEDWQANVFTKTTRNKVKALIAGIAKQPPKTKISAVNENNYESVRRSEVMEHLVDASYKKEDNPEMVMFFDSWDCAINGTKIKYDGYLRTKNKVKHITDYDPITGEVKYEEREVIVEDRPVEVDVLVQNFYISDPNIPNVQDQPEIIWFEDISESKFNREYGKFKNSKYVQTRSQFKETSSTQTFFNDQYDREVGDDRVGLIKYYCKESDTYGIIANGVVILKAPLLWGRSKKMYPFAKTIFEPFANSKFFWGNSLPNILMSEQDVENALVNSLTDKTYRSLIQPTLIGITNRDSFDLEDEYIETDTKIYVQDVTQVKPMPVSQINSGETTMLQITQSGLDKDSTDQVQGGTSGSGSTAREIVIANERAEELKGAFFVFMKDLYLQKTRLRVQNILMNYSRAKTREIVGEDGATVIEETYNAFALPNSELSTGERGTLKIEVKKSKAELSTPGELDLREEMARIEGRPIEIIQITSVYLDNFDYDVEIQTESLYQRGKSFEMAMTQDFITGTAKLFPEIYASSRDIMFEDWSKGFSKDPRRYLEAMQKAQQQQMIEQVQMQTTSDIEGLIGGGSMGGAATQTPAPPLPNLV